MKQDLDLIRRILFKLEENPSLERSLSSDGFDIPGASSEEIVYQLLLLQDAGYIVAKDWSSVSRKDILVSRMTWAGHEFLEAARDDTRWSKAKTAATKVGSLTISVIQPILVQMGIAALRSALGLP